MIVEQMHEKSQINFLRLPAIVRGRALFRADGAKSYPCNKLREVFDVVKTNAACLPTAAHGRRDTQAALVII
jgi:hypothetical protein